MKKKEYSLPIGGKPLIAEFNDLAEQTNGSVLMRYGNTVVLITAVMGTKPREGGGDFFPLTVDYEERFYASGQILGSRFIRREGRPSDEAILSGRIVDRTIRPLFDSHVRHEVQVVVTILSLGEDDPDILAVIGASLALGTSDIPWNGPVSGVRIGKFEGRDEFIVNPTYPDREQGIFEMEQTVCGKDGNINMIENDGREMSEGVIVDGLTRASEEIERVQAWQKEIIALRAKAKIVIPKPEMPPEMPPLFEEKIAPTFMKRIFIGKTGGEHINELKREWLAGALEKFPDQKPSIADNFFEDKLSELIHEEAIMRARRADGRKLTDVRPLFAKAGGISPILHGSGIFYRGATHIFSALTLGGPGDAQIIDGMEVKTKKRFMHHYNFPPYSSGEVGRIGGTNRRMTGHGALAEKALKHVLPPKETFPYTIRIVSESLSSNGSTSMGSVCASALALMDAGVPIKAAVAGIASGLMLRVAKSAKGEMKYEYALLTDIQGPEDHHGDMDLKVAGTRVGVTAIQMDVKVDGIPLPILAEALVRAKDARHHILDTIEKELAAPRPDISPSAPKIILLTVKPSQIGLIIGTGGKTINEIKDSTGVDAIDIEDDGSVFITGKNGTAEKAAKIIADMTREYKAGERFDGVVTRIADFGAFVRIGGSTEGLLHISEIAPWRINKVTDVLKEGETIPVIVKEVEGDRIRLSLKDIDPDFAKRRGSAPGSSAGTRTDRPHGQHGDHRR
ncbi:MAG: polyribonucleotide nucleotidyltransferase [Parcubacteria group bacterium Gr01-1014_72]|nr:MAG: polyribonucleotide nucleotidyltransferase [Parcubacteria group bacterium Gr01-1014_72]